jgi:hypothetical protein
MLSIPSPPTQEREADSSPAPQESGPQVLESGKTPLFSGGLFPGWGGSAGPSVGGQRTDVSIQSNRSGDSERAREQTLPLYVHVSLLLWCIQHLKSKVESLRDSLPQSFSFVRDELDEVWKELGNLHSSGSPPHHRVTFTPPLFQGHPVDTVPTSLTPTLLPASFQHLMRQVVDELRTAGFVP